MYSVHTTTSETIFKSCTHIHTHIHTPTPTHPPSPSTPQGAIHDSIQWLDHMGMGIIEQGDAAAFRQYLKQYGNTICGRRPISVFLNVWEGCCFVCVVVRDMCMADVLVYYYFFQFPHAYIHLHCSIVHAHHHVRTVPNMTPPPTHTHTHTPR